MSDTYASTHSVLNYSGMLYEKGNTRTPFLTMIAGKTGYTDHTEFVLGQEYDGLGAGAGSQPEISETASLTAPEAGVVTRIQKTNVTQIFQEAVAITYKKMSNMGTLSGVNIANQEANPMNELDFQVGQVMAKIANDIEYTFINGVFQKDTADNVASKTRGMVAAIETYTKDLKGAQLGYWDVVEVLTQMNDDGVDTDGLVLWASSVTINALNADAVANGFTVIPADREVNGIKLDRLITPVGDVYIQKGKHLPAGTTLLINFSPVRSIEMPVPGKGNFFLEPLAKTGAGEKYQIFGQIGLDYGVEWAHAKFTNGKTTFEKPESGKSVVIVADKTKA